MKHSMRWTLGLLFFGLALNAWGEAASPPTPTTEYSHYFGMAAGFVTGTGISYRYWPDTMGFQITTAPLVSNQQTFLSLGANGLFLVSDFRWSRFYTYLGISGSYSHSSWSTSYSTSLGGGFGMELILFENFGLDLQGGFRGFVGQEYASHIFGTGPTFEGGIFYRL